MNRLKTSLLILSVLLVAVTTMGAKPDPTKLPFAPYCNLQEDLRTVHDSGEPMCIYVGGPPGIAVFVPRDERRQSIPELRWMLQVRNSSFELVEPCRHRPSNLIPGRTYSRAYNGWGEWNTFNPDTRLHIDVDADIFFVWEPCEPGDYFIELTVEHVSSVSGQVLDLDTWLRRWDGSTRIN